MPIVSVPKILRTKLGDDGAEALVEFFNEVQEANSPKEEIIEIVEEKFERRLSEEMGKLRVEMAEMKSELRNEMAEMKSELRGEMADMKSELNNKMGSMRADIIKWMFVFWVGQIGVMIGILFAFFK